MSVRTINLSPALLLRVGHARISALGQLLQNENSECEYRGVRGHHVEGWTGFGIRKEAINPWSWAVGIDKGTLQPGILGTLNANLATQFIKKKGGSSHQ